MKNLPSRVCQVFPDRLKGPLQVNKQEERQGKNIESAQNVQKHGDFYFRSAF